MHCSVLDLRWHGCRNKFRLLHAVVLSTQALFWIQIFRGISKNAIYLAKITAEIHLRPDHRLATETNSG